MLLIDSNSYRQRQLRTALTSLGFKASTVEHVPDVNAAEVLLYKRQRNYDWCFIALMPATLGFIRGVRATASTESLPLILYSGDWTREDVLAAKEAGSTAVLSYPFSVSAIEEILRSAHVVR